MIKGKDKNEKWKDYGQWQKHQQQLSMKKQGLLKELMCGRIGHTYIPIELYHHIGNITEGGVLPLSKYEANKNNHKMNGNPILYCTCLQKRR